MNRMTRKFRAISCTLAFATMLVLALSITTIAAAETITVDNNIGSSADYTSIQAAVNGAHKGDTILVYPGIYKENVNVNVENLSIRSFSGNPEDTIVKTVSSYYHVFNVSVDYVEINGFTIRGASNDGRAGVYLHNVSGVNISDNILLNNLNGIYLSSSNNNVLIHNKANSNYYGISLADSKNNSLAFNIALANNDGITLRASSDNNDLVGNLASSNRRIGVDLDSSSNNILVSNEATSNSLGIALRYSSKNNLTCNLMWNNTCNFMVDHGLLNTNIVDTSNLVNKKPIYYIVNDSEVKLNSSSNAGTVYLINCKNVSIQNLWLEKNGYGICLYNTTNSSVKNNTVCNNVFGIALIDSKNSTLNGNYAIENSYRGIVLDHSVKNNLTQNYITEGAFSGLYIDHSSNCILTRNLMWNNTHNFIAFGNYLDTNLIDTSNLVDEKPIYYFVDEVDIILNSSSNAGTVYLINCENASIKDLLLEMNGYGICLYNTRNSELKNVTALNNSLGINLEYSSKNNLTGNFVKSNTHGIFLFSSSINNLNGNNATENKAAGIFLSHSGYNNLSGNKITKNKFAGVHIWNSFNSCLTENTLISNRNGLYLSGSSGNTIYNNYFNSTNHIGSERTNSGNSWNTTKKYCRNIVDGNFLGGNYWAKPDGSGFSQTHEDANLDGICDEFYDLGGGVIDYLPLKVPEPITPDGNFSSNVTEGYAPLSILFVDLSENASDRVWDFENDGKVDSTSETVVHSYVESGTYTVNFTAINGFGIDSKLVNITVLKEDSGKNDVGNKGSSSSSGGGGGGSPEPASNVESKELSQAFVTNGNHVKFEFTRNATCVRCVEFDAKRTFGKTTTIVEMLKGKSKIVPELPPRVVYKNVNIWVGNEGLGTPENIENALIGFKVEKSWIMENGIDLHAVTLYRYHDGVWNALPTVMADEDDEYFYFTAETPGFSPFAIAGEGKAVAISPEGGLEAENVEKGSKDSEVSAPAEQKEKKSPGFTALFAISGILSGMYLLKMRKDQN
ncbi:NosD domain-containing protein [Methanosarcina sp. Mfa9]|uniref:NosD domain-containing protein n=1 Tax=Methanosarcina sp. Mfa9 TaxID=3439063 RepID=UPI003F844323